jgi:hypothetical protein
MGAARAESVPKEDSDISSVEMVYGLHLTLLREMCSFPEILAQEIVEGIRSTVTSFQPLPTWAMAVEATSASLPEALQIAKHVYVLQGGVIPALSQRYQGPCLVLSHGKKCLKFAVGSRVEVVSLTG